MLTNLLLVLKALLGLQSISIMNKYLVKGINNNLARTIIGLCNVFVNANILKYYDSLHVLCHKVNTYNVVHTLSATYIRGIILPNSGVDSVVQNSKNYG